MSLVETYMSLYSFVESRVQAPPMSAPPRTRSVRSVCNKIFVRFGLFVFKNP